MHRATVLWAPYPYKAGFCVTDDTDYSTLLQVKTIYDFLMDAGFPTTRAVWSFPQIESCGIPPYAGDPDPTPTLQNKEYARYCEYLHAHGFEICSHGASGGNNSREMTEKSIALIREKFGAADTYIQHSKNADNLYYEEKVAPNRLLRQMLKLYSKNDCSGEIPGSPYFWGDICREHVRQIRLFRTRSMNTLKVNPAMPYFDPAKPWVRAWFTATRRALHHCATPEAIERLKRERGLTLLYQYLKMYVDPETGALMDDFREAVLRLVRDKEIWIATAADVCNRLRAMHGVFVFYRETDVWMVNTNPCAVRGVQILIPPGAALRVEGLASAHADRVCVIDDLPADSTTRAQSETPLSWKGRGAHRLPGSSRARVRLAFGYLTVNLSSEQWTEGGTSVPPGGYRLEFDAGLEDIRPLSRAGFAENYRMFFHQMWIILRQILFQGRSFNTLQYGKRATKRLHSHYYW